jgi:hypothetical protein
VLESPDKLGATPEQSVIRLIEVEATGTSIKFMDGVKRNGLEFTLDLVAQRRKANGVGARIKSSMMRRAMRGMGVGKLPYGYRVGSRQRFEVIPEEADVVHSIFLLRADKGYGIRRIAGHLNEHGITTRSGGKWNMITVRDILRNRSYIGTYTRFGMSIPGSHPPIVSNDLFKAAQFGFKSSHMGKEIRPLARLFSLSGFVQCGSCGNTMIGVSRKRVWLRQGDGVHAEGLYRYYQCQSRTNQSVCRYHTRNEAELEAIFLEAVSSYVKSPESIDRELEPVAIDGGKAQIQEKMLHRMLEGVRRRQRNKVRQGAAGIIDHEQLKASIATLTAEERAVQRRLARLKAAVDGANHKKPSSIAISQALAKGVQAWPDMTFAQRQAFLHTHVDTITVHDDRVDVKLAG